MFTIKLCKNKGSYEVIPKNKLKLNLNKLKSFEIIEDAKIFIIVKIDNCEIIVQNYGDLIFKDCEDKEKIKRIAEEIYDKSTITT